MLERVNNMLSRSALQLPPEKLALIAGSKPYVLDGRSLDPQLHLVAKAYEKEHPLYSYPIKVARTQYVMESKLLDNVPRRDVESKDRTIPLQSEAGSRSIGIRIYTPSVKSSSPPPIMVFYHGGGWAVGEPDTVDALCSGFSADLGHIVVSVAYRLAPEHKYPAAADDAIDSFLWIQAHAAHYGGDANRVYVAGDSAGGNLAAVVSQQTVKSGLPSPCAQVLIYPATDLRNMTPSHHTYGEGFPLSKKTITWFVGHYLSTDEQKLEIKASPGLAEGDWMSKLPPALITTAGFDVLRDEGERYADRLKSVGVPVEYHEYSNLMHAYVTMTGHIDGARMAVEDTSQRIASLIDSLRS